MVYIWFAILSIIMYTLPPAGKREEKNEKTATIVCTENGDPITFDTLLNQDR